MPPLNQEQKPQPGIKPRLRRIVAQLNADAPAALGKVEPVVATQKKIILKLLVAIRHGCRNSQPADWNALLREARILFKSVRLTEGLLRWMTRRSARVAAIDLAVIPQVYGIALAALKECKRHGNGHTVGGIEEKNWKSLLTFCRYFLPRFEEATVLQPSKSSGAGEGGIIR